LSSKLQNKKFQTECNEHGKIDNFDIEYRLTDMRTDVFMKMLFSLVCFINTARFMSFPRKDPQRVFVSILFPLSFQTAENIEQKSQSRN